MPLALIYARSENYCIGHNGSLPWNLPDEYEHFDNTTINSAIIMGRKTYEDHQCELPYRLNIVVTSQENYPLPETVLSARSLQSAIEKAKGLEQIFVIGGGELLNNALPLAETVYETVVHTNIHGDTFVEAFDFSSWHSELQGHFPANERHQYAYSIYRHSRPIE